MIYRNLRQISTGQWLNVLFTFERDDPQNIKAPIHRNEIAASWSIAPADLEAIDSPTDARVGMLLQGPVIVPPPDPAVTRAATLVDTIDRVLAVRTTGLTSAERAAMQDAAVSLACR